MRATDNCKTSTLTFGSRNCGMQKSQHSKNILGNCHKIACSQKIVQTLPKLSQPEAQFISPCLQECPEQPRTCRGPDPEDYVNGRRARRRFLHQSALGYPKFGCVVAFSCLWWILTGGMFHMQVIAAALPLLDNASLVGRNLGIFNLKMSSQNQYQQKLAQPSKNQIENKQDKVCRKFLKCFEQNLQCLQTVMQITQATSQNKRLNQPRKMCLAIYGGWRGSVESGECLSGRLLSCCLLHPSAFNSSKVRRVLTFLLVSWIITWGEIVLQASFDYHMCGQEIASLHAQSSCLSQVSAVVGMSTIPAHFTVIGYPDLDMYNTCHHGNTCPNCSVENLQYTKIQHPAKIICDSSFTMVAASKLPAYRPAGTQSGQRRPNESFEQQIQRWLLG